MTFNVLLHPKAAEFVRKLGCNDRERVKSELSGLKERPEEKGKHLRHSAFWSLRIGDYRAIYEIDERGKTVTVLFVGHKKNVYDNLSKLF